MKNKFIWLGISFLMVAAMLLASCAASTTTSTSKPTSTTTTTKTTTTVTQTTTTTKTTTTPTTTTATGHWWDSLGIPQYGGEMVLSMPQNIVSFDAVGDPFGGLASLENVWDERLTADDWTLDPAIYKYVTNYRPSDYVKGLLAESWEFTDPSTYVIRLHKGIHWQNIPPVNGREFTSADVVWNFDRMLGLGDGFTKPSTYFGTVVVWQSLISVTAIDNYTVAFKWKVSNFEFITEGQHGLGQELCMRPHEVLETWGNFSDWHHAIGTGPFILQDFVSGSSMTLVKNPNYWGHDERYPQNQLPYVDTLKMLIIPDQNTTLAGVRSGKIAAMDGISLQQAQSLQKTNPELSQISYPDVRSATIDPRNDLKPFSDIRVRKALQMAINLPDIAANYYGGNVDPSPATLTSRYITGWGWPYAQWPQDLKDEYAYNLTAAKKLMADAGYATGFNTDVVVDIGLADQSLLQIVKASFAALGISMSIQNLDSASWNAYVRTAKKHTGFVFTNGSLGLATEPLRHFPRFMNGQTINWCMVNDPVYETFYPKALAATDLDGIKQVMRDTNEYVARQHFTISLLTAQWFGVYQPWFKGYTGQNFAISGVGSGAFLLGFYGPRFWIAKH